MKKIFTHIRLHTDITRGICPNCEEFTTLVSLTKGLFRCITCGFDIEQKVNGKISYVPVHPEVKLNVPQKGQ